MGRKIDLTGETFGRWTVVRETKKRYKGSIIWTCRCECGIIKEVSSTNLTRKRRPSKSCGCLARDVTSNRSVIHGLSYTKTYRSWYNMIRRCYNIDSNNYHRYGGRGIFVCRRWRNSFENFFGDMGKCPVGFSIDRMNNDGPYGPWNCQWTSRVNQNRNQSSTILNEDMVKEIRRMLSKGKTVSQVSLKMALTKSHISKIKHNKIWKE